MKEQYGRLGQFDPNTPNANAGGAPGCGALRQYLQLQLFIPTPIRTLSDLVLASRIKSTTRPCCALAGGINYQFTGTAAGAIVNTPGTYPLAGINPYVNIQSPGSIVSPTWPVTDPNRYPQLGTVSGAPNAPDRNINRPPRINQWSIGLQREITRDLIVEATYVGNTAVWINGAAPQTFLSQISPAQFASMGLYPYPGTGPAGYNNDADRALLSQPPGSAAVIQRLGHASIPYTGFAGTTLLSSLYPSPQFGALAYSGAPTGKTKYDALQIQLTKRFSHGLPGERVPIRGRKDSRVLPGRISGTLTRIHGLSNRFRRRC